MASEPQNQGQTIRSELLKGLVPLLAAILGGLVVAVPTYLTSNRQMDVKMVEIAVGILSQKPEANIEPARSWAVDVIQHYAQVELTPDVKKALIENRALGYSTPGFNMGYDTSWDTSSGPTIEAGKGPSPPDSVPGLATGGRAR